MWPPAIQEAEERMFQAKAAVLADIESEEPYNAVRRHNLLDALEQTQSEFLEMVRHFLRQSALVTTYKIHQVISSRTKSAL